MIIGLCQAPHQRWWAVMLLLKWHPRVIIDDSSETWNTGCCSSWSFSMSIYSLGSMLSDVVDVILSIHCPWDQVTESTRHIYWQRQGSFSHQGIGISPCHHHPIKTCFPPNKRSFKDWTLSLKVTKTCHPTDFSKCWAWGRWWCDKLSHLAN